MLKFGFCVVETVHAPSLHGNTLFPWRIKFIILPIGNIVFNIRGNTVHFGLVTNNTIMETGLPCKIYGILVGKMGDGRFQTANGNSQSMFLFGNNQNHDDYLAKNEMIRHISDILSKAEYMGETMYNGRVSKIFRTQLCGKDNYIIVNYNDEGELNLYSITTSPKVLVDIKK